MEFSAFFAQLAWKQKSSNIHTWIQKLEIWQGGVLNLNQA